MSYICEVDFFELKFRTLHFTLFLQRLESCSLSCFCFPPGFTDRQFPPASSVFTCSMWQSSVQWNVNPGQARKTSHGIHHALSLSFLIYQDLEEDSKALRDDRVTG